MNILDCLKTVAQLWPRPKAPVPFTVLFKKFKSILERNNRILELMSDMGDKLGGEYIFDRQYIVDICENLNDNVFKLISDLCILNQRKNLALIIAFERIQHQVQEELAGRHSFPMVKPVMLLDEINSEHRDEVGNKFACLGDIRNILCLPTMDGFVITTKTFFDFMQYNNIPEIISEGLRQWDGWDGKVFAGMCRDVQQRILDAEVPRPIKSHINAMVDIISGRHQGRSVRFAVRSSAWGEDGEFSFAGQYESLLNIAGSDIIEAYKHVVAGAYSPEAWQYRMHRGYLDHEVAMAVGCQIMVEAASSGVMYTYAPIVPERESIVISGAWGLGPAVVEGTAESDTFVLDRDPPYDTISVDTGHKVSKVVSNGRRGTVWRDLPEQLQDVPCLNSEQAAQLAQYGMVLERYYRRPQDVEWAYDGLGNLYILQSRPLRIRSSEKLQPGMTSICGEPVISGKGITVQEGVASGKVHLVRRDSDLDDFPQGAILVAKYTSPKYSRVMNRAAAIITDVGSATGHMATLAREYRVPSIVNAEIATRILSSGDEIIIDAGQKKVFRGVLEGLCKFELNMEEVFEDSYEYRLLRRLIRKTNKLNLIDPNSDNFAPENCRTYHDITRYIHEKAVEKLIDLSQNYQETHNTVPRRLECDIPLGLLVIDIENGQGGPRNAEPVRAETISSFPMKALLDGLCGLGMWESTPVPVDVGSFMSSVTRTFSANLSNPERIGRNLAVISKEYMNLNLRLGYHFNVVDAYISDTINDNYIYFRFFGGVTEATRRSRRARFIAEVLERFDFRVEVHGDMVVARMKKSSRERMLGKMRVVGALIGYTRQLDVLMNEECRIAHHLEDFTKRIQPITESQHEPSH